MAGNTTPIFSKAGLLGVADITNSVTALVTSNGAAATGISGAAGEMFVCATAATDGSYIQRIRIRLTASTPTATTAVTLRLYTSTVTTGATTNANTDCFEEIVLGIQNAANATAATFPYDIPCNFVLPSGQTILASVHQKPATNTEIQIITYGGNY